uniref:Uncharacterized protein n=1 Tax=Anguilla anguilla TaxID=7936 RepID=A0A0E9U1S1_ANGAN
MADLNRFLGQVRMEEKRMDKISNWNWSVVCRSGASYIKMFLDLNIILR